MPSAGLYRPCVARTEKTERTGLLQDGCPITGARMAVFYLQITAQLTALITKIIASLRDRPM